MLQKKLDVGVSLYQVKDESGNELIIFLQTSWPDLLTNRSDISDEERTVIISRVLSEHADGHADAGFLPIRMHPGGFKIH